MAGVPFRAAELYEKKGVRNKHTKGGDCAETPFVQVLALPTGSQYFVNVDPAQLAKTGFTIKFTETGAASEITLNSEPSGAGTIEAITGALTGLLPFVGVTAEQPEKASPAPATVEKACDAGEKDVTFEQFTAVSAPPR